MYNTQTFTPKQVHKINFRAGLTVIVVFCILTIVSYFNELAKAGLLSRNGVPFLPGTPLPLQHDNIILQKDGNLHQLDLNLEPLRNLVNSSQGDQEIKIAVHLGKNDSYNAENNSIRIYKYEKVIGNFFLQLNESVCTRLPSSNSSSASVDLLISAVKKLQAELTAHIHLHSNSTAVFMYQHNLCGYWARDCFISQALHHNRITSDVPLNSLYRTEWEQMHSTKKAAFQFLYGPLSFGVCENLERPCTYVGLVDHPLDKALQTYYLCNLNASLPLCAVNRINETAVSAVEFISRQGSVLFQKLLYHQRHCKLVGSDEVCIHDTQTFFLLGHKDKMTYLADILENLDKWFSVVGLVSHMKESLQLFNYALGWNLTSCSFSTIPVFSTEVEIDGVPYMRLRESLLNHPDVLKSIGYDLAIYAKLEDIFSRQMKVFDLLTTLNMRPETDAVQLFLRREKLTERVRKKVTNLYRRIKNDQSDRYMQLYNSL